MLRAYLTDAEFSSIADEVKKYYSKSGDGYLLQVETAGTYGIFRDPANLRQELETANTQVRSLTTEKERLKTQLDASKSRVTELEARGDTRTKEEIDADFERRTAEVRERLTGERDTAMKERDTTRQMAQRALGEAHIRAVLEGSDVRGNATLLLPILRDRLEVEIGEDGKVNYYVKSDDGHRRVSATESGPMQLKEYVLQLKKQDDYAPCFGPERARGSGIPDGDSANGGGGSLEEQVAAVADKSKPTFNLTKLGELYRSNPARVGPLAARFGMELS